MVSAITVDIKMKKFCALFSFAVMYLCVCGDSQFVSGDAASYSSPSLVPGEHHIGASVSGSFSEVGGACSEQCHEWLVYNESSNKCECLHNYHGIIKCDPNSNNSVPSVLDCYCATFVDELNDTMVAGSCFYNCENNDKLYRDYLYHNINSTATCDKFNRKGILCGECKDHHYPLVYSFNMTCVEDLGFSSLSNYIKFFTLAIVPSTFFFFLVVIFKISVTSSFLHGFVLFSQGISFPANMRIILQAISQQHAASSSAKIIASLYGFWNLDFFRPLLPGIPLRLTTLQVLSLDYVVAVYPLLLVASSYVVVALYYHNFGPIVFIARPFRRLFSRFQRPVNVRSSIMDAYATFFLLSYTKFLSASFDILMPTEACYSNEDKCVKRSYYDGSLLYFKGDHLQLALIALAIGIIFIALPTLILLLYPFRFSQFILRKIKLHNSLLEMFVSPFYRCYKDGTEEKTYDCRWFASLFLILRIILPLVYAFTLGSVFFPLAVIIIFIFVMILITVKPYKNAYSHFIKYDVTFLLLLSLFYLSMISIDVSSIKDHRLVHVSYILTIVFGTVPLLYLMAIVAYWLISRRNQAPEMLRRFVSMWKSQQYHQVDDISDDQEPDRLLNPTEYENNSTSLKASASVGYMTKDSY